MASDCQTACDQRKLTQQAFLVDVLFLEDFSFKWGPCSHKGTAFGRKRVRSALPVCNLTCMGMQWNGMGNILL